MNNITPFSGLDFFILVFSFIAFLHLFKRALQKVISYKFLLFIAVVAYIYWAMPTSRRDHILVFALYMYGVYRYFCWRKTTKILLPMVVIALPMVLYKLDISEFHRIVGISYITFRVSQAVVDRKNYGELSFVEFITFILLPTSLLAGPIDRSYRFKKDLDTGYAGLTYQNLFDGWDLFIVGLLFKFVLGALVATYWMSRIDVTSMQPVTMLNSAYAYNVYLFFDFAGYSSMAVGLSRMFGIMLPMNFDKPYLAQNPQDFWRRFHITLGTWLTDYFFKPIYLWLNGKKRLQGKRLLMQNSAIIATFLLMGIWNGFRWYYIVSGFLFGLYSAVHNWYVLYVRKGGFDFFTLFSPPLQIWVKRFLMFHFAVGALYVFSGRVPL